MLVHNGCVDQTDLDAAVQIERALLAAPGGTDEAKVLVLGFEKPKVGNK